MSIGAKRLVNGMCGFTFCTSLVFALGSTFETASLAPGIIMSFFKDLTPIGLKDPTARSNFLSAAIFVRIVTIFCIFFNVLELLLYIIIFLEMYRHHKNHVRLCLANKPKLAKMKKRRNAVSAVGNFVSWAVEMLIFGLLQYILLANQLHFLGWIIFTVLMPSINFLIFPLVQILSSKDLRDHVFNVEFYTECCCSCTNSSDAEQQGQGAGPENIELQVMNNGHAVQVA